MKTFKQFRELVQSARDSETKDKLIKQFIEEQQERGGFPIIENEDVTFIFQGKVRSKITMTGDINDWHRDKDPLQRIEGTDFYYKSMKFPLDARIEYAFIKDENLVIDQFNKKTGYGGLGIYSELQMPQYTPSITINYNPDIPHGKIKVFRFRSEILNNNRMIHIYLPPGFSSKMKYQVIYAQDGSDYLRFGYFDNVLDHLIHKGEIKKVIGIFIDPDNRLLEYDLNKDYVEFLNKELVPFIDANYPTQSTPSNRLVMGASFGGLISSYAAFKYPEIFGNVASQSGYLSRKKDWIIQRIKESSKKKIKFYLDCGTFENDVGGMYGDFTQGNRRMQEVLRMKGYDHVYQEFNEGHNWGNWRSRINTILKTFFSYKEKLSS